MEEIDLVLVKDDTVERTFVATFLENGDPQDLTGYTVKMIVYKDPEVELPGVIGGVDNNEMTFEFDSTVNNEIGMYEYEIIATPTGLGDTILLGRGNITFSSNTGFTTQIQTIVEKEAKGIALDQDWINQSIIYWKLYLQDAFDIPDSTIHDDSAWPPLSRFLIGLLVVHDYIAHLMEVTIASSFSSTNADGTIVAGSGAMKKLTTGPSSVEWYDSGESLAKMSAKGANGQSAFDAMGQRICGLAGKLQVYLIMCDVPNYVILPERGRLRHRCYPPAVTLLRCTYHEPDRG